MMKNKTKELEEFDLIEFVNSDDEKKQSMLSELPVLDLEEKKEE